MARHPSQLYEAGLEGIVLGLILWFMFWKTDARYKPGRLVGTFILVYGISRFLVELVRQPDEGLEHLSWGLTMGQTLDGADDRRRHLFDRHRLAPAPARSADRRQRERRLRPVWRQNSFVPSTVWRIDCNE